MKFVDYFPADGKPTDTAIVRFKEASAADTGWSTRVRQHDCQLIAFYSMYNHSHLLQHSNTSLKTRLKLGMLRALVGRSPVIEHEARCFHTHAYAFDGVVTFAKLSDDEELAYFTMLEAKTKKKV